ncbi:MAG: GreA/GreB family elongation factor [Bdellovibrio sp.]|nr:GreA/GreB family elongation factor [Bdellovibrio sp.]
MDKASVLLTLKAQLEKDLAILKHAALATYDDATNEENKPENKYDTRALEASYLAGAQAQRVKDVEELISICKFQQTKNFKEEDPVAVTAIVEVESNGKVSWLLFLPKGGGFFVHYEDKKIQVITPASPIGKALLGLRSGEIATIDSQGQKREYEILSVC